MEFVNTKCYSFEELHIITKRKSVFMGGRKVKIDALNMYKERRKLVILQEI